MKNLSQNFAAESWEKISPTWPLQNIIACNPLRGFENLSFEEALKQGARFFQNDELPAKLEKINQLTIKWCQVFFDQGQSTISMPGRDEGFYQSWKKLAIFDDQLHQNIYENIEFIKKLPNSSESLISQALKHLKIDEKSAEKFLTILLTTLSGWSSYVKYLGEWSYQKNSEIENDYLAIRLAITCLIWPEGGREILKITEKNSSSDEIKAKVGANQDGSRSLIM